MYLKKIDKSNSSVNEFNFYVKDGFVELAYLSNSPEAIIKSIVKLPFIKHYEEKQCFESDTQFLKTEVHYRELEKGFWLICADARYMDNVNYRRITEKDIPADYYMLSLEVSANEGRSKPVLINGMTYSKCTWLLFKPKVNVVRSHFKDSHTLSYAIFFSEKWLKKVLYNDPRFLKCNLKKFFESKAKFIIWPDAIGSADTVYKPIQKTLDGKKGQDVTTLKKQADKLLLRFINIYDAGKTSKNIFDIPDNDRKKIEKAASILVNNIHTPFIGIESLSRQSGISSTQLKRYFKMIYGQPVFQYFRQKQMEHARTLIEKKTDTIKEIAHLLGYENASKFSAAFKKQFGILPSEVPSVS